MDEWLDKRQRVFELMNDAFDRRVDVRSLPGYRRLSAAETFLEKDIRAMEPHSTAEAASMIRFFLTDHYDAELSPTDADVAALERVAAFLKRGDFMAGGTTGDVPISSTA